MAGVNRVRQYTIFNTGMLKKKKKLKKKYLPSAGGAIEVGWMGMRIGSSKKTTPNLSASVVGLCNFQLLIPDSFFFCVSSTKVSLLACSTCLLYWLCAED